MGNLFERLKGNNTEALQNEFELQKSSREMERKRIVQESTKVTDRTNITLSAFSKLNPGDRMTSFLADTMYKQMEIAYLSFEGKDGGSEKSPSPFSVIDFDSNAHELLVATGNTNDALETTCENGDKVVVIHSAIFDERADYKTTQKTGVVKIKNGKSINIKVDGIGTVRIDSEGNLSKIGQGEVITGYPLEISDLRHETKRTAQ